MLLDPSNQPVDRKFLGKITSDFVKVAHYIKEAAYHVKSRGFSDFPIFPISEKSLTIGKLLYNKEKLNLRYNYNLSYLDEFVQIGLVDKDKQTIFKANYKSIDEFCCFFVVDPEFTNFLFVPYPED